MRKVVQIILVFVVIILISAQFCIAEEKAYTTGYQNTKWGMSSEQVKECVPMLSEIKEGKLYSKSTIAGYKASVYFNFVDNRLYKVSIFLDELLDGKAHIKAFYEFEDLLTKKYGKVEHSIRSGKSNPYLTEEYLIGIGERSYEDVWYIYTSLFPKKPDPKHPLAPPTPEMFIKLFLYGENSKIYLSLTYHCTELNSEVINREQEKENEIKKRKEQKGLGDL